MAAVSLSDQVLPIWPRDYEEQPELELGEHATSLERPSSRPAHEASTPAPRDSSPPDDDDSITRADLWTVAIAAAVLGGIISGLVHGLLF